MNRATALYRIYSDIEACHRILPKENAAIIAKFNSRKIKEALMLKDAKQLGKKLRISDVGCEVSRAGSENDG
eukprot:gene21218-biopygen16247